MIRLFLLVFLLLSSYLFATEEIQRIDSIVNDIEKLRHSYEKQLFDLKEKNIILEHENSTYKKKITDLQKEIKKLKKQQTKQVKSPKPKVIVKEKIQKIVITQPLLCEDENKFPQLKLKNSSSVSRIKQQEPKIIHFQAAAFRLREDADIYGGMHSRKVVDKWEKGTSFTSNVKTTQRIKITGYFINKVWKKADKEMWIERSSVQER